MVSEESSKRCAERIRLIAHSIFVLALGQLRYVSTRATTVVAMPLIDTAVRTGIATITIDRAPVNALTPDGWEQLTAAIEQISTNTDVRVVVLTGANGHFCAGADISVLAEPQPVEAAMLQMVGNAASAIQQCRVPVIAAVDGAARGGGFELILACDIVVAGPSASFAASGVNMGVIASVPMLAATVGPKRAATLLFTGQAIDAEKAGSWGIVSLIDDDPLALASSLAESISSKAPLAVEANKTALRSFGAMNPSDHADLVTRLYSRLEQSADHGEAVEAFLEKRDPNFSRS